MLLAAENPQDDAPEAVRWLRLEMDESDPCVTGIRDAGESRLTSLWAERRWYRSVLPPPPVVGRSSRAASEGGEEARRFRPPFGPVWYSSEMEGLRSLMFSSRMPLSSMPNSDSEKMLWS